MPVLTGTEIFYSNGQTETGAETKYTILLSTHHPWCVQMLYISIFVNFRKAPTLITGIGVENNKLTIIEWDAVERNMRKNTNDDYHVFREI